MFCLIGFDHTGARTDRFDVFKTFLKNDKRLSNVVHTNRSILSRNNKANAFYSPFRLNYLLKVCLRKSNMHGSEACASHRFIQGTIRRAPFIPLSKFV